MGALLMGCVVIAVLTQVSAVLRDTPHHTPALGSTRVPFFTALIHTLLFQRKRKKKKKEHGNKRRSTFLFTGAFCSLTLLLSPCKHELPLKIK